MKVITDSKTVRKYSKENPDLSIVEQMELEWPLMTQEFKKIQQEQ